MIPKLIEASWSAARKGLLYVVVKEPEKVLYLESPEFQGLDEEDPQYDLARAFASIADVQSYKLLLERVCKVDLVWESVTLKRLFQLARKTNHNGSGRPMRVTLTGSNMREHIDDIWIHDHKAMAA